MNNKAIFSGILCGLFSITGMLFGMNEVIISQPNSVNNSPRNQQNYSKEFFYVNNTKNEWFVLHEDGGGTRLESNPITKKVIDREFILNCTETGYYSIQKTPYEKYLSFEDMVLGIGKRLDITQPQMYILDACLKKNVGVYVKIKDDFMRIKAANRTLLSINLMSSSMKNQDFPDIICKFIDKNSDIGVMYPQEIDEDVKNKDKKFFFSMSHSDIMELLDKKPIATGAFNVFNYQIAKVLHMDNKVVLDGVLFGLFNSGFDCEIESKFRKEIIINSLRLSDMHGKNIIINTNTGEFISSNNNSSDNRLKVQQDNTHLLSVTFYVKADKEWYILHKNGKETRLEFSPITKKIIDGKFVLDCNNENHWIIADTLNISGFLDIVQLTKNQINNLGNYLGNNLEVYADIDGDFMHITRMSAPLLSIHFVTSAGDKDSHDIMAQFLEKNPRIEQEEIIDLI